MNLAKKSETGFTLIEAMIVVAMLAIIMAIAVPSFTDQMRRSRRAEAVQALQSIQLQQEKRRSNFATYATALGDVGVSNATLPSGYYTLSLSTPAGNCAGVGAPAASTANSYTVTATAAGPQAVDTQCATMSITSLCGVVTKTSTGGGTCW